MVTLPTIKREKPLRKNPKRLIIYGREKSGKTTSVAQLPDTLILNLETGGTDHLANILVMDVIGLSPPKEDPTLTEKRHAAGKFYLSEVYAAIKKVKKETGTYPYKRVVVDTATKLEEWCEDFATLDYMQSVQGKSFNRQDGKKDAPMLPKDKWESVLTLPQGAGYLWLRLAFAKWLQMIDELAPDVILIAHLKEKQVNKAGKETTSNDLALTGKVAQLAAQSSDAIGYIYRQGKNTVINFASTDDTCGSRCAHLKGKSIVIMEEDANNNIIATHWDKIYIDDAEESSQ